MLVQRYLKWHLVLSSSVAVLVHKLRSCAIVILRFQIKILRVIANATWHVHTKIIHSDLTITWIKSVPRDYYNRYRGWISNHRSELVMVLLNNDNISTCVRRTKLSDIIGNNNRQT